MQVSKLMETVREDYLDDLADPPLWSDKRLLRGFTEAERQACNRANLIYDDTTASYTRITLVSGKASYNFDPRLTVIESILFDGNYVIKKTKEEMDRLSPTWRTDTGMAGNTIYAVISGRTIRFSPLPDATDAGEVVSLETYRLPDQDILSTSQSFEIPEENHRDLIYWVLHECYKKQDSDAFNQEKSDYYLSRFDEIFGPPVSAKVRQHQFENGLSLNVRGHNYTGTSTSTTDDGW